MFLTSKTKLKVAAVLCGFIAAAPSHHASAAIIDVPYGMVNVLGIDYYLNFTYSDAADENTFNIVNPTITFIGVEVLFARDAIIALYLPNELPDTTPPLSLQGFYIPVSLPGSPTPTAFDAAFAIDQNADNAWQSSSSEIGEQFLIPRDVNITVAAAEFSPAPIPPALWLFGSGLLGLIGIAKRKK